MKPTDWAYLAGLLDGEGCITSYQNADGWTYLRIRLTQSNPPIIRWLEENVGGRVWRSHEGRYTWGAEGVLSREILKGTYKYLTYKKPQAKIAYHLHQLQTKEARMKVHYQLRELKKRQERATRS